MAIIYRNTWNEQCKSILCSYHALRILYLRSEDGRIWSKHFATIKNILYTLVVFGGI